MHGVEVAAFFVVGPSVPIPPKCSPSTTAKPESKTGEPSTSTKLTNIFQYLTKKYFQYINIKKQLNK